ncbi:restriction endonuclease subunit S [Clostridium sp. SGI.024]|uniref:restriction endonuclease subunit S n=1 Tax=Clostridium sp. SGI.024 TaxID=3420551 RepID=UPI003D03ED97|nr:restriction endonuclease subunit S [Clostridium sp.]
MSREMKDSEVEWIGSVPKEWNVGKLKSFSEIKSGDYVSKEMYQETGSYSIIGSNGEIGKYNKFNNIDNVIVTGRVGTIGNVQIVGKSWITDNVLIIKNNERYINQKYLSYALKNIDYNNIQTGTAQPLITASKIKEVRLPIPQKYTQIKIANYLDKKVSQIDDIISKQKSLIEKYKAYKQSLITETVIKGLNKNVPMKDSGIEWIGEIPSNWNSIKVKHTCDLKGRIGWQGLKSDEFIEYGPYLITGINFKAGAIDWNTCFHITEERYNEAVQIQIREGDLLITKDGTIGKLAIVKNMPYKTSLNSGVLLIRNISDLYINKFLYYILASNIFWTWYKMNQTGNSTILHLYQEKFKEFEYTLPNKDEQIEIIEYLDKKCSKIDSLLTEKEKLILKLEDYKKSLIYECVTGKREVN